MNDNDIQNLLKKIDNITSVMEIVTTSIANSVLTTLVTDQYETAVLHIDSGRQNQLVITITNQTNGVIDVQQFSGPASSSNCNVTISFSNDAFYFYTPPSIDPFTQGSWQLSTDSMMDGLATFTWQILGHAPSSLKEQTEIA